MKLAILFATLFAGLFAIASENIPHGFLIEGKSPDKYAREELEKHLKLIGLYADASSTNSLTLVLGEAAPGSAEVPPFTSYGRRVGNKIYLWGDDTPFEAKKRRKGVESLLACRPGTLFAVYGFLEDQLGFKWVRSGDIGIVIPQGRDCPISEDWSWSYTPPLDEGVMRSMQWSGKPGKNARFAPKELRPTESRVDSEHHERLQWMLRMRHFVKRKYPMSHAFTHWYEQYGATHPEYFAVLEDGLRTHDPKSKVEIAHGREKLCVSNEAVVDQIIADWRSAGAPKDLNICPNDSHGFCMCPNCRALDVIVTDKDREFRKGYCLTDRYVNFWNRIAKKAIAVRPDVKLGTYIYSAYRQPPRREKIAYPDNMVFGMVPTQEEENDKLIAAWKAVGLKTFKLRPNYLCHFGSMPRGYERFYFENFKLNYREGMVGTDYDGGPRDELSDFECYSVARCIQDPKVEFDDVERDYLSQFGLAASLMRTYYSRIRKRGESWLYRVQRRKENEKECVLDDSELYKTVMLANPRVELEKDLGIIDRALVVDGLSEMERSRLVHRKILAVNAIKTHRFYEAYDPTTEQVESTDELVKAALDLHAFRVSECVKLPHTDWGTVYRAYPFEVKWWRQKDVRTALLEKDSSMSFAE